MDVSFCRFSERELTFMFDRPMLSPVRLSSACLSVCLSVMALILRSPNSVVSGTHCVKVVEDVLRCRKKKFTFAISSSGEFLLARSRNGGVLFCYRTFFYISEPNLGE